MDHARSSHPRVQAALDRLSALGPGADVLGLDRITRLLARLGDPHHQLPPAFHVAGTNGKGSTCAYLRAALEASGHRVHVYTSPHLVRFNERIRVAGRLIEDEWLADLLEEVLTAGSDIGASFFEVTTAVAFLAFARIPADACVIEVGLGGRLDATNVLAAPAACGIAQLGLDHQAFLGDTIEAIAREKAGIAKRGRPLVSIDHGNALNAEVRGVVETAGARLMLAGRDWSYAVDTDQSLVRHWFDLDSEPVATPLPALPGMHQSGNLALAIAMLRAQDQIKVTAEAMQAAAQLAQWPARMQRLRQGPLTRLIPGDVEFWLDGGHNAAAAEAVASTFATIRARRPAARTHLVLGMLANKDPHGLIAPLAPLIHACTTVPVPGHACHEPEALAAIARELGIAQADTADNVPAALNAINADPSGASMPRTILLLGSLYLAGEILAANAELPD